MLCSLNDEKVNRMKYNIIVIIMIMIMIAIMIIIIITNDNINTFGDLIALTSFNI